MEVEIFYFSFHIVGVEDSENVPADVASFAIDRLQEGAAYQVLVSALFNSREGPTATVTARTGKTTQMFIHLDTTISKHSCSHVYTCLFVLRNIQLTIHVNF